MEIKAPKGTKDILPAESRKWDRFFADVEMVFKNYGYGRIETPVFESEGLFARAIGESTDIVKKEMYVFEDKGGRRLALRPEETAGVVRAFIEHKMYTGNGLEKIYYKGQMFRYERPQGGRQRQFWQIGVEALGSSDPALDAEVIDMAVTCLDATGLGGLELKINSVGCPICRPAYTKALKTFLNENQEELCATCRERTSTNPLRVFDCKNEQCRAAIKNAPLVIDHLCEDCADNFNKVKAYLDTMSVDYTADPHLVRGLDYYTKTTFEITAPGLGAQNAVAAGGRYDNLVKSYGGPDTPGLGFAIGIERALLALGDEAAEADEALDAYIITLDEESKQAGLALAKTARASGLAVEMDFTGKNMKKQMANADKSGARYAVIIGSDELLTGSLTIRDMASGEQRGVDAEAMIDVLSGHI
ncbi:MAG: histidine--tRNA ligase [Actinomycetota bacterium]